MAGWEDSRNQRGTTHGSVSNEHMQALLERGAREGADSFPPMCGCCNADLGPSTTYPWHYEHEDCRAIRPIVAV